MERERIDAEVVVVGAGPAGLACALQLARHIERHNREGRQPAIDPEGIFVLEKAAALGMHTLSGAVMDPRALAELEPDFLSAGAPVECAVSSERVHYLSEHGSYRLPYVPAPLRNQGHHLVSLGRLVQWLGGKVEAAGASVFTATAASELIVEDGRVAGVITGEQGLDSDGRPQPNHEPGYELRAKVTVLAEGSRGSLTRQLIDRFDLAADSNPQAYALGLKEIWEIPKGRVEAGTVWHSFGYPLPADMQGGGWMYAMSDQRISVGLVVGLHYEDAGFQPHTAFQRYKQHPLLRSVLEDGSLLKYGAKTMAKGGYWALPRLHAPGALLVGDAAGFLDAMRLKGVHTALKSGMLAADATYEALCRGEDRDAALAGYKARFESSWLKQDLWRGRNHHQMFQHGLRRGLVPAALQALGAGRGRLPGRPAHAYLRPAGKPSAATFVADGLTGFDRAGSVYHSGTQHRENQPVHLRVGDAAICVRCHSEFGSPCQNFCPAGVYEWDAQAEGGESGRLRINAANCLHCKACDILDPYQNITWTPPEGGGGPHYEGM
jgi:electron-transferring-flavoprotein dehydrogenase